MAAGRRGRRPLQRLTTISLTTEYGKTAVFRRPFFLFVAAMAAAVCAVASAGSGAEALALLFVFNEGVDNGSDNGDQNKTNQNISQHGKRSFLRIGK